ncbi:hypothetical protein ACFLY5_00635, partial [Patescibacteria group bacterium]
KEKMAKLTTVTSIMTAKNNVFVPPFCLSELLSLVLILFFVFSEACEVSIISLVVIRFANRLGKYRYLKPYLPETSISKYPLILLIKILTSIPCPQPPIT